MPWEVGRGSGPVPPVSVEPKQTLKTDRRGAVIVEMALVLPLLVTLLLGLVCYGQYFLIAHRVQPIANDAARATLGGLTSDEPSPQTRTAPWGGRVFQHLYLPVVDGALHKQTTRETL